MSGLLDLFLKGVCKQNAPVSIYLMSGIKLQGYISSFDSDVILLKNSFEQVVFKHAIATVVPACRINLDENQMGLEHQEQSFVN